MTQVSEAAAATPKDPAARRAATAFVLTMGVVAMFGDMTYEGARGLVGAYLGLLGASAMAVGFAAGLGEFLGYALRLVSGWLGDRTRAYWPLVIVGYSLNLVAVPGLAFVDRWPAAAALLVLERIGKAIRSPARSTLMSYAASQVGSGRTFAIEEALDQFGAVAGPLITALAIWLARSGSTVDRYRTAFLALLVPAVLNVLVVALARRRYASPEAFEVARAAPALDVSALLRWYVLAAALVALGFADWALLAFHASRTGALGVEALPLVYAAVMGVDALAALAAGLLFDRFGVIVLAGAVAIGAAFAPCVFLFSSPGLLFAGVAAWGIGLGAQESIFKAVIAELVPKALRGRAYGVFFALFGLAWWLGSTLMGWLYARSVVFLTFFSLGCQLAAVPILVAIARRLAAVRRGAKKDSIIEGLQS